MYPAPPHSLYANSFTGLVSWAMMRPLFSAVMVTVP